MSDRYIYAVRATPKGDDIQIERAKIFKETDKLFYAQREYATGYRAQVPKDGVLLSEPRALEVFIVKAIAQEKALREKADALRTLREKAQQKLDVAVLIASE